MPAEWYGNGITDALSNFRPITVTLSYVRESSILCRRLTNVSDLESLCLFVLAASDSSFLNVETANKEFYLSDISLRISDVSMWPLSDSSC